MPAPTIFPSIPAENSVFDRMDQQQANAAGVAGAQPDVATRLVGLKDRYPWLAPDVTVAMARAGLDADSQLAQTLAQASAKVKSKSGFGWHSVGDLVGAVGSAVGQGIGDVGSAVADVAKPVVRNAVLGLQSIDQEAQGVFRNVASYGPVGAAVAGGLTAAALVAAAPVDIPVGIGAAAVAGAAALGATASASGKIQGQATWEPQSEGAIALQRRLAGKPVDFGSGWLPHPDQAIQDEQKARETVTVGGHALTPGRLLAAGVVQPGTTPYNVLSGLTDAGIAMSRFDPAAAAVGAAGNALRNRNLFIEAGGLLADRPTIDPTKALDWWHGEGGRAVAQSIADEANPYEIWKATGKKLPIDVVRDLAPADNVAKVDQVITPMLGAEITGPLPYDTFKPLSNVRMLHLMPQGAIDLGSDRIAQADAVKTAERWLQNVKASPDVISDTVSKMINAESPAGRYRATADMMDATKQVLVDRWGVDPQKAGDLTRLFQNSYQDTSKYFVDGIGENVNIPDLYIDGQSHGLPQPHLFAEMTDRTLPLPAARDIRSVATKWAPVLNNPLVDAGLSTMQFLQDQIWKPFTLIRGALATRTLGEAQARMAAGGLDSAFNHPLSYIAWATNPESKVADLFSKVGLDVGKGATDVKGADFLAHGSQDVVDSLDVFNKAMNRRWAGLKDEKYLPFWRKVGQEEPGFTNAWAGELMQLESDPIAREVARSTDGLDGVKQAFWDGNLSGFRQQMVENAGGLASRDVADAYVQSVADRIATKTGNDPSLLKVIGTSSLDGAPLRDGLKPSSDFLAHLEGSMDSAPEFVKGQVSIKDTSIGQRFDDASRFMFSKLMAEPQNKLVNSPTFKQFYWDRIRELAPMMTDEARAAASDVATKQGLPDVASVLDAASSGEHATLGLDHADAIAKGDALDKNWQLLHKLSDRNQFFDAARLVFPFGDAWAQMLGKWAKIGLEHPESIYRATQVVNGGQEAGFFYKNAQGQEVFAYPGSGWVNDKLFGVPVPFTGRLDGLSMATEVMPGVGPVVQVPAGALLPDKPQWDWARSVLFPNGEPDTKAGVAEAFLPAWAQKMREAGVFSPLGVQADQGQWNSTVFDVARYLSSTGNYDTSTVDGMNHLLGDARDKAKYMYLLRGAAQFWSPSAPTPEWMAQDKTGHLIAVDQLAGEYHDLQQTNPQGATQAMLDKYGTGIFTLLQGKTMSVLPGSITSGGADWERSHGGFMKSYPEVGSLFAPDTGDLDSAAFQRQLDAGNRVRLTPDQALRLANNRLAATIYNAAKDKLGARPSEPQRQWLTQLRTALIDKYPGYQDQAGIPGKADPAILVGQLQKAVLDPRVDGNPAAGAARLYFEARSKAQDAGVAAGLSNTGFASSKSMAPMRDWLRQLGTLLVQAHPEFQQMWDTVFSRELVDDTAPPTTTQGAS